MKLIVKTIFKAFCLPAVLFATSIMSEARTAVLVTHYGSSDNDTRTKTIDLITADIRQALPETEVRQAFISPVVRRNLERRGIMTDSPVQALLRLASEGYDSVYVQSTTLIDGVEMAEVRDAVGAVRPFFKSIGCSTSLCYSPEDCEELVKILAAEPCAKDEAVIYCGHGNNLPSTATYAMLDYMMQSGGCPRHHVSTIEGFPTAQTTAVQLKSQKGIRRLKLIPLLLVCGNHTKNDIAVDFAEAMTAAGYECQTVMRGLAENPAVRALYVARLLKLMGR